MDLNKKLEELNLRKQEILKQVQEHNKAAQDLANEFLRIDGAIREISQMIPPVTETPKEEVK